MTATRCHRCGHPCEEVTRLRISKLDAAQTREVNGDGLFVSPIVGERVLERLLCVTCDQQFNLWFKTPGGTP